MIVCAFGYLDLRFAFSLASLGVIVGIILMIIAMVGDKNGWEDLIGVALFLQFSVSGLAVGVVAETVAFFIRRKRERKQV